MAGDLDADGDIDIMMASPGTGEVFFLENDGSAAMELNSAAILGEMPWAGAIFDFDGDGALDLAVANDAEVFVTFLLSASRR